MSKTIYTELHASINRRDKNKMLYLLTTPMYEFMMVQLKKKTFNLPFEICPKVNNSKIVAIRATSNTGEQAKEHNFFHVTVKMDLETSDG
jgi:hypothetical protein